MIGIDRRQAMAGATLATLLGGSAAAAAEGGYGSVGRLRATPGQGAVLAALMLAGTAAMPGCRAYRVAQDAGDPDLLWVWEEWTDKAAHDASLALPAVRAVIARARPLIAGFESGAELKPLGGVVAGSS